MAASEVQPQQLPLNFREKLCLAGVLSLVFLTFASTFTFAWVYDDPPQIPGNADLRWDRLGYLFSHHLWASANGITNARFYRPLLALWFLLNKTLFGLNPHWFHVTSVLAHLLATALAFFVARGLLKDTGGALLAAALFGIHPLQAESVSWISAVNDPLAALFCFASFLACKKARTTPQNTVLWLILAGLAFLCALLVKEVSVVLPAIVLVDFWFDTSRDSMQQVRTRAGTLIIALYAALAIFWLALRHRVLGQVAASASSLAWSSTILTAPKIMLFQLYRVILPVALSPHYDFRPLSSVALSLFPSCALIVLAVLAVLATRKAPYLWLAYAWLVLPLLPSLNTRWLNEDDFVHDRYMYMSMLGVALLVGAAFVALKHRWPESKLIPGLAVALVIGLAFASTTQSQFWANDVALFSRGVQIAPNNEWAQLNYGAALSARGKYADAAPHFVQSYQLKAGWRAADYAGFTFQNAGDLSGAEHWFTMALQNDPSLADAWFGLGQIRLAQQRPAEAVQFFRKAVALAPDADGYHYALGSALEQSGQPYAALDAYQTELRLHPTQTGARKAIERLSTSPAQ